MNQGEISQKEAAKRQLTETPAALTFLPVHVWKFGRAKFCRSDAGWNPWPPQTAVGQTKMYPTDGNKDQHRRKIFSHTQIAIDIVELGVPH